MSLVNRLRAKIFEDGIQVLAFLLRINYRSDMARDVSTITDKEKLLKLIGMITSEYEIHYPDVQGKRYFISKVRNMTLEERLAEELSEGEDY